MEESNPQRDIELGYYISITSLLFESILLLSVGIHSKLQSSEDSFPARLGVLLSSAPGLLYVFLSAIVSVYFSKRVVSTSHPLKGSTGQGPFGKGGVNKTKSGDSTFLRRSVRRFKQVLHRLSPLKALLRGILRSLALLALLTFTIFCFGANILNPRTWYLALLLFNLSCLKPILLGEDTSFFQDLSVPKEDAHLNTLLQHALGAFLGAWIGAFPIPLDWDRDWQDWPISCVLGAHLGALASHALTSYKLLHLRKPNGTTKDQKWKKLA